MKKFLLFAFLCCMSIFVYATDEVRLHKGDTIKGEVVENEPSFIKFIYEGEKVPTTIGKFAIASIKFSSGRIEECTKKVYVNDPNVDFEKINVFRDKEDVFGLVRITEITAKSGGEFAISDKEGRYIAKTIKKLQKQAAKMGGCAILITSQTGNSGSFWKSAHSAMTAVVYRY